MYQCFSSSEIKNAWELEDNISNTCCDLWYVIYFICGNVRPCSLLCVSIQSSVELPVHLLKNIGIGYDQVMTLHSKLHLFWHVYSRYDLFLMDPSHFQIHNLSATTMLLIERDFSCYDPLSMLNHLLNHHYCTIQIKNYQNSRGWLVHWRCAFKCVLLQLQPQQLTLQLKLTAEQQCEMWNKEWVTGSAPQQMAVSVILHCLVHCVWVFLSQCAFKNCTI